MIEMDITGIAKSHQTNSTAAGKASSKKEWKLSDSLREKITEYAREDAAQNVYMGNKFLALRKSEVAKVAPDRADFHGFWRVVKGGVCHEVGGAVRKPIKHKLGVLPDLE